MNLDNMRTLVGQLERLPDEKFLMSEWIVRNECGTVACIAGWASILNGGPVRVPHVFAGVEGHPSLFAQKWLGLTPNQGGRLFGGNFLRSVREGRRRLNTITRADAIRELNRLIAQHEASATS